MMQEKLQRLQAKLKEVKNLRDTEAILGWDQQVFMPPGGAEARAEQMATVSKLAHELFVVDEIGELLHDLAQANLPYDSDEASLIRVVQRDYQNARKLPALLVAELSRTFALGQQIWSEAKANQNFAHFQEILTKIVDLNIQVAEALGYEECLYDALLDQFEPGMPTAEVNQVFDTLKVGLVPLVEAIGQHANRVDASILAQEFDETTQWNFGLLPLQAIGFDLNRGRQDKSAHPFTISFSVHDVRITTRVYKDQLPAAIFGTLHEGGHGLYEQNSDPRLDGTFLAGGTSMATHESQSRLWENVVGRSREFWQAYYPKLQEFFPAQLQQANLDTFYRAINQVKPSFTRVEADEVTYNLHIFLRFELEQELLEGRLKVADLPEAWNAKTKAYLGFAPPNDALGVLQDIHWAGGIMGYFPTYTLGNVMSLQFYQQTLRDIPDLPRQFSQGEFGALLNWFKDKVHRHGRKFTANELLQRVTGSSELNAQPYLNYINQKYSTIYGL
jgi:carboxypeptidase Taq